MVHHFAKCQKILSFIFSVLYFIRENILFWRLFLLRPLYMDSLLEVLPIIMYIFALKINVYS